jgi:hypothetical protein
MNADGKVTFGLLDLHYNEIYYIKAQSLQTHMQPANLPEIEINLTESEFKNINGRQSLVVNFNANGVDVKWPALGGGSFYDLFYSFSENANDDASAILSSVKRVIGKNYDAIQINNTENYFSLYVEGVYVGVEDGQLGIGNYYNQRRPAQVPGINNVKSIMSNYAETCSLDSLDYLYCWGRIYKSNVPMVIRDRVSKFAMGGDYLCLSPSNARDSVQCKGGNYYGQLGNGTQVDESVFVNFQIPTGK